MNSISPNDFLYSASLTHLAKQMEQRKLRGYGVTVFHTSDGDRLFISDPQGNEIYAHRTNARNGMDVARTKIEAHLKGEQI